MLFRDRLIGPTGDAGNGGTVISREREVGYGDGDGGGLELSVGKSESGARG